MLAEALEALAELAVKADVPKVLDVPGESPAVKWVAKNGGLEPVTLTPLPRDHKARDLQAILGYCRHGYESAKEADAVDQMTPASVWYDRTGVVMLFDDGTRRDRITLPLDLSVPVKFLMQLESTKAALKQADLIYHLRTTFAKSLSTAGNLLDVVRSVKFDATTSGTSNLQHGKASIGKSIAASITGTAAIPEYVAFNVPIFDRAFPGIAFPVECALDPDPHTESFKLVPLPGEVERAVAAGEGRVGEILASELADLIESRAALVLYGKP